MSPMRDLIQIYLNGISVACKVKINELYRIMGAYELTTTEREKWGFPMYDTKNPTQVVRSPCVAFDNSVDPNEQTCRCGKRLSLLKEDWYADDKECCYHWGKRTFWGGPENGLFSCCKRMSEKEGCIHHKYHTCCYKPMKNDAFVSTPYRHSDSPNIFALDCEMVYTTVGLEVARVSLVTLYGETVYDSFVQPPNRILDFNTSFSGISTEDLIGVTTTASDARASILKLLNKDSFLIGHGLENDLVGLHLFHDKLIDTSILFAHEKGYPFRNSLKTLACKYLRREIHCDMKGHNSVEDARTCVALLLQKMYLDMWETVKHYNGPSKCNLITQPVLFNFFSPPIVPRLPGNFFQFTTVCYRTNPVLIIPKIVQFETPSFPIMPPQFPYFPMAVCQF